MVSFAINKLILEYSSQKLCYEPCVPFLLDILLSEDLVNRMQYSMETFSVAWTFMSKKRKVLICDMKYTMNILYYDMS